MKLVVLKTTNPYRNLAIEEFLFKNSDDDVFMLWQNEPTVVIGKNQNAYVEINFEFTNAKNIHIARRITGGGAVYHDLGNLNYTFISVNNKGATLDFEHFTKPIIEALSTIGITAELSGRNDLIANGKKISGNAQYANDGRVLHHGTLLFNSDLTILSNALNVDKEKIESKAIKSVRARVTNISELLPQKQSLENFIALIKNYTISKFNAQEIVPPISDEIDLLEKRNGSTEWIFPNRDLVSKYKTKIKKRFDFGTVEVLLEMKNDVILNIKIIGDFFELNNVEILEDAIRGKSISKIAKCKEIDVGNYILEMKNKDFISLILG